MQVRKAVTGAEVVSKLDHHHHAFKKKEKKRGVFVWLVLLGVEQSWQGDFLFLARNFSWMHYAGAENRKGVEESY